MSRVAALVALALLTTAVAPVTTGAAPAGPAAATTRAAVGPAGPHPDLVAVYPNPVPDGDAGEYVLLEAPPGTNLSGYVLSDGEETVALPATTVSGRVALTAAPTRVRNLTEAAVVELALPGLANGGERLRLRRGNRMVAALTYEDAPEAERLVAGEWRPVAGTDREAASGRSAVRAFVLPDAARAPVAPLRRADERLWLGAYTLTSARVRAALVAAERRGVDVRVVAEPSPVGGISGAQAAVLDELVRAGVAVQVFAGPYDPYAYHHAKYAVADGEAVVLTENWKPAGTGGHGSRGWGVLLDGGTTADAVAATFRADWRGRGTVPWERYRRGRLFDPPAPEATNASFPSTVEPLRARARATVLVAPDNAERHVLARIRNATESVAVLAPSLERRSPFYDALVGAARRGVAVRVLLSGAWYSREENRRLVEALRSRGDREGIPLSAKVAEPRGRFAKIHAKGLVVDDTAIVGSMNFNRHSARRNRELVAVLESPAVADYYREVFDADWAGGGRGLPIGMAAVLAAAIAVALLAAARIRFDGGPAVRGEDDAENPPGWEF